MLNHDQYLAVKIAEELAEASQRAMKLMQFGPAEVQPGQPFSNSGRLRDELLDVEVWIAAAEEFGLIDRITRKDVTEHIVSKGPKMRAHYDLAVSLGQVEPGLKL